MDNKENKGVEDVDSCSSTSSPEEVLVEDSTQESSTTAASSSQDVFVLDDDIVKEEENLHKMTLAKEEETKHLNEERMQTLAKDGCYERLKFLLTNCVHYTSHLHRRMEEQRLELARAIEKQRAQNAEKDLKKKAKLAASRVKGNKGGAEVARGARSSSRLALQETVVQKNSSLLQSSPAAIIDDNNNTGSKKRRRTQSPGSNTNQDTSITLPKRKRAKISEDESTIAPPALQGDSESQESAVADMAASDAVDGGCDDSGKDVAEKKNEGQPILLTGGTLRKYQVEGYKWLQMLYENAINGILADEMGLGKTIQCIALICELVANGLDGPFLICGPLSTLPNWISEFTRFAPKIPSILYHGSKSDRLAMLPEISRQQKISAGATFSVRPVVITSYEIAMNDRQYLSKFSWKLLIVDEGHRIKNSQCRLIQELKLYNSNHRLLLTGTPLQNNMAELWSLLNFLIPEIFDNLGSFETWFDAEFLETVDNAHEQIIQEEQRKHTLSMLHQILQPFVLRRLKCDVEIIIPPKRELLVYAPLVAKQQEMYRSIVDRSIRQLVEGPPLEEQCQNIECNERGRPIRKVRKNAMDLKLILDNDDNEDDSMPLMSRGGQKSNASENNADDDDDDVEKWAKGILSYHQEVSDSKKKRSEEDEPKALVNVQLRNLMALLRRCCNHPYLIEYPMNNGQLQLDEKIIGSCGKLMLLDRMLTQLIKDDHKVLIFSQMTMMLNILEDYLSLRGYGYSRLDGSMSMTVRQQEMKRFAEEKDVPIFLLSTRAGGLGINLTQADTVIIYDSDWNPQCDLQAQDRCHRIGQVRPVVVYRLVTANTVDQKIVERATAKRKLEKLIMHKGKFKLSKALGTELLPISPQELLDLLKETDYTEVAKGMTDSVISDEDLRQLLDRSDLQRIWNCRLEGKKEEKEPLGDLELKGVFKVVSDVWDEPVVKGVGVATSSDP